MKRHILAVIGVGLVTAVVGAQGPQALSTENKVELFRKNRSLIETVVNQTVVSSKAPADPLKRADSYYLVVLRFSEQIRAAKSTSDEDRAKELTDRLTTLLDQGLVKTLDKAKGQVEGGTGVEEFRKLRQDLLNQLDALLD